MQIKRLSTKQKQATGGRNLKLQRQRDTILKKKCNEDQIRREGEENTGNYDDRAQDMKNSMSFSPSPTFTASNAELSEKALLKMAKDTTTDANTSAASYIDNHSDMAEMKYICSVGFFRATPIHTFRRKCKVCMEQNVVVSSRVPMPISKLSSNIDDRKNNKSYEIFQYDRHKIIRRLTNEIDWKDLCGDHDMHELKNRRHATKKRPTTTALNEIVLVMTNPMVIPRCCHSRCLIDILLNALLMSPPLSTFLQKRKRSNHREQISTFTSMMQQWTPSQQFLLETVRELLLSERMPPNASMTDYVQNFMRSRPLFSTQVERSEAVSDESNSIPVTTNRANRLLSAIYWLLNSSLSHSSFSQSLERVLLLSGLFLLQRIDCWNIQIDTELMHNVDISNCSNTACSISQTDCERGTRRQLSKVMTVKTLSNLHDEPLSTENNTNLYNSKKMLWRQSNGRDQQQLSLKNVLAVKRKEEIRNNNVVIPANKFCSKEITDEGNVKRIKVDASDASMTSSDWSTIRSRFFKKFVAYVVERQQQHGLCSLRTVPGSISLVQNSNEDFLRWLVNIAVINQESPSLRVCLVVVAHSLGVPRNPQYFQYVAHLFWEGYLQSNRERRNTTSNWLRLYSEWLSECASFDQLIVAWSAMQPIIRHITACLVSDRQDQFDLPKTNALYNFGMNCNRHVDMCKLEPSVLACIGYIFHRRIHLFDIHGDDNDDIQKHDNDFAQKSSIKKEFRSFVNLLSIYCGESSEIWLRLFSNSTRESVESTLKQLGILSFHSSYSNIQPKPRNTDYFVTQIHSGATSNWPFSEEFGLRKAMRRINPAVMSLEDDNDPIKSLLSYPNKTGGNVVNKKTKSIGRSRRQYSFTNFTNFVHNSDILCLIFSFCGSKRLTKIAQVCKSWKAVSDAFSNVLWENAYVSNFGEYRWHCLHAKRRHLVSTGAIFPMDINDSCKQTEDVSKTYWKNIFIQKQIAQKMVRFQRNQRTGYKHRTCSFVGCLKIIKSEEQEIIHNRYHERLLTKQRAALQKKIGVIKKRNNIENR